MIMAMANLNIHIVIISSDSIVRWIAKYVLGTEHMVLIIYSVFFFQAEDGIRDLYVTGVQTCALPIYAGGAEEGRRRPAGGDGDGLRLGGDGNRGNEERGLRLHHQAVQERRSAGSRAQRGGASAAGRDRKSVV